METVGGAPLETVKMYIRSPEANLTINIKSDRIAYPYG